MESMGESAASSKQEDHLVHICLWRLWHGEETVWAANLASVDSYGVREFTSREPQPQSAFPMGQKWMWNSEVAENVSNQDNSNMVVNETSYAGFLLLLDLHLPVRF